jgi:integrase
MKSTIEALASDGRAWPLLSADMRHERMQWLMRLFGWLSIKGYLTPDPSVALRGETGLTKAETIAAKRIDEDDDEEGREPFTVEQIRAIFSQQHYQTGDGKHVRKPRYWYGFEYWLPLLGLYAGLRIKEASQLHLADVRAIDEVWRLDINRRTPDKSLKNDQSVRLVPVHPELVRLGFLRYCDQLRAAGYRRVFPELTWSRANAKYAKESGRKMSHMLKMLGMPRDGKLVFHCLRHNANNALIRVPVTKVLGADEHLKKYIRHRIMGHEVGKDVNAQHYTNTSTQEMFDLVAGAAYELPQIVDPEIFISSRDPPQDAHPPLNAWGRASG